jgi:hypothetical protein
VTEVGVGVGTDLDVVARVSLPEIEGGDMKYGRFATIARQNPPGRVEKSITFRCVLHSDSDASSVSYVRLLT